MTDTDLPVGATKPTIFVDWDTIDGNPKFQNWLRARGKIFNLALLVSYPDIRDYTYFESKYDDLLRFDSVVRNTGKKRELEFKLNALEVYREVSSSVPVAILDGSFSARAIFAAEGLIALSDVEL